MKTKFFILGLSVFALVFMSCSMPQGPSDLPAPQEEEEMSLAVETDTSRNQGIYINEKGVKIDIISEEDPDGTVVACVKATAIVRVDDGDDSSKSFSSGTWVKALVIGKRDDGNPGVWEIHNDDSIHPVRSSIGGRKCSLLEESEGLDRVIRRLFGWVYHVTMFSEAAEDGRRIIVGYAEHKEGIKRGRWLIEKGTRVAVYWKLNKSSCCPFFRVSRARIIGTPAAHPHHFHHGRHRFYWFIHYILSFLRLFFLNWLDAYLIEAKTVDYDKEKDAFIVTGIDQDGADAVATIYKDDHITIEPLNGVEIIYDRIVIDTYEPRGGWGAGFPPTDTYLTLFDDSGSMLEEDNDSTPYTDDHIGSAHIYYTDGLISGTYYIRVTSGFGSGPYAIRVLSLNKGAALPNPIYFDSYSESTDYDDDDSKKNIPNDPIDINVGNINAVNRRLNSSVDIDWLKFVLP